MCNIKVFWGSDEKFNLQIKEVEDVYSIIDALNHINVQEVLVNGKDFKQEKSILCIENLVINTDDYGGMKKWVLMCFSNYILENTKLDICNLWLNNPPLSLYKDIMRNYRENVIEEYNKAKLIELEDLKKYRVIMMSG